MTTFNHILPFASASDRTSTGDSEKTFHIAHTVCACIAEEYSQGYLEGTRALNAVRFHDNKRSFSPSYASVRNYRYNPITTLRGFPGVS
jgi:hypothetical protein